MLLVEPFLLHWFGATLGKWIFGFRVTTQDHAKLSYSDALARTWDVFSTGYGYNIVIYRIYCLWRSYKNCSEEEEQIWESDSQLSLKDERGYRIAVYAIAYVSIFALGLILPYDIAMTPPNRGNLSIADYVENFNQFSYRLDCADSFQLDHQGSWVEQDDSNVIIMGSYERGSYEYTMDGNVLTSICFHMISHDSEGIMPAYSWEKVLSALAFVYAREGLFPSGPNALINQISDHSLENWQMEQNGVTIANEVTIIGYSIGGDFLLPKEDEEQMYEVTFSMTLNP